MNRREFLATLGATALSGVALAQSDMALIGWLDVRNEADVGAQASRAALQTELARLGWIEGRNLRIDRRFGTADSERLQVAAANLVALAPRMIIAGGAAPARTLQRATQTIPIVVTGGGDTVANGLVKNIARPEGNITGFSSSEPTIASKWLELLKAVAPSVRRVAIVFNPDVGPTAANYVALIEAAAQRHGVTTVKISIRDTVELVRAIDAFATAPDGAILLLPPGYLGDTVVKLAAQHRLPAMFSQRAQVVAGGLISYNSDPVDQHRRAAAYVDRILRGAMVADLPVQLPTKYQLVVNARTARAIGLAIPEAFSLQADEVIE